MAACQYKTHQQCSLVRIPTINREHGRYVFSNCPLIWGIIKISLLFEEIQTAVLPSPSTTNQRPFPTPSLSSPNPTQSVPQFCCSGKPNGRSPHTPTQPANGRAVPHTTSQRTQPHSAGLEILLLRDNTAILPARPTQRITLKI